MRPFLPGIIWMVVAVRLTLTKTELVKVHTKDNPSVSCQKSVTLHCNVSSEENVTIDDLFWSRNHNKRLCAVGNITLHTENTKLQTKNLTTQQHRFVCNYNQTSQLSLSLSLTLQNAQPFDKGTYTCKLFSNRGIKETTADLEFQGSECYKDANESSNDTHRTCTFTGVYPDGEVHWFQGSNNLTGSAQTNTKQVETDGALTVTSSLKREKGTYNCSLWIPSTGVYLASRVTPVLLTFESRSQLGNGGVVTFGPVWKLFWVFFLCHFIFSLV
ncbi:hypothetical protein DPEC_G00175950 [Dallia pectoralis]|uniref:Uncharacterized protein n=1 Tax=Dallia pectoralis TaxID=75939 RepID=A0ACC2GEW3_DALPE|nr:hypothetical protein DPEC_G00175950 [Dallia pectoralis]